MSKEIVIWKTSAVGRSEVNPRIYFSSGERTPLEIALGERRFLVPLNRSADKAPSGFKAEAQKFPVHFRKSGLAVAVKATVSSRK